MQRIKFKSGKTFDITCIMDFGSEIEISFKEGTSLQEVIDTYEMYNNPKYNAEDLRTFELYDLRTNPDDAEGNATPPTEFLQGTHVGYTILKKTIVAGPEIKVRVQKEIEVVTDVAALKQENIRLHEKNTELDELVSDLMLIIAEGGGQ